MTMAVAKTKDNNGAGQVGYYPITPTSPKCNRQQEGEKSRSKLSQNKAGRVVQGRERKAQRKNTSTNCWKSANTNTTMQTSDPANKRVRDSPQRTASKKTKDQEAKAMDESFEDLILESGMVSTEVNNCMFDITPRIKEMGGTDEDVSTSKKAFLSMAGTGGMLTHLHAMVRLGGKVVRYGKSPTTAQESDAVKSGLSAEEWLRFSTSLANKETHENMHVSEILNPEEQLKCMIFLNRVAHTGPQVTCGRVQYSKCKATSTSTCWYGAKTALGSWYVKDLTLKQKKLNIKSSLALARETTQTKEYVLDEEERQAKKAPKPSVIPPTPCKKAAHKKQAIDLSKEETSDDTSSSEEESDRKKKRKTKKKSSSRRKKKQQQDSSDSDSDSSSATPKGKNKKKDQSDSDSEDTSSDSESEQESKLAQKVKKAAQKKTKETAKTDADGDTPMGDASQEKVAKVPDEEGKEENIKKKGSKKKHFLSNPTESADSQAKRRTHQVRLQLMIKIKSSKKKTPNQLLHQCIADMFRNFKEEDDRVMIMPWKFKDSAEKPGITTTLNFPDSYAELRPYLERCRPKSNSNCWTKIRIAMDLEANEFVSQAGSAMCHWYDDHECLAFRCPVQASDKTAIIGAFLYSGKFIDAERLNECLIKELETKMPSREIKMGCKARKMKEVEVEETVQGPWSMAANQLVQVEADAAQARTIHQFIYRRFNKTETNVPRPGEYNLRYLPSKEYLTSGTKGNRLRQNMIKKHKLVVEALQLVTTDQIKYLDTPHATDNGDKTLRTVMHGLSHPLVPKPNQKKASLIHSIDWATTGEDAGATVYITAYEDRIHTVQNLVNILPAFIEWYVSKEAAVAWLIHQTDDMEVTFHCDTEGNWLGGWTTSDDQVQSNIIDEDMGYEIRIDNMEEVQGNQRRILSAEDASLKSFGLAQGRPALSPQPQADEESAAAASGASGGSGVSG